MGYVVRMPQLGMTMEEGIVVEWTVDVGEPFDEDDVIAVVESEKTTNDVEAREAGRILEQFVGLEEPVGPGDPIAYVGEEGESVPDDIGVEAAAAEEADEPAAQEAGAAGGTTASSADDASSPGDAMVSPRARA